MTTTTLLSEDTEKSIEYREEKWNEIVDRLDIAFQPIANIHTGACFGFEALLRNYEEAGYSSIRQVINEAWRDGMSLYMDLLLREKTISKIKDFPEYVSIKLLYNIDNRTLLLPNPYWDRFLELHHRYDFSPTSFCLEISERHDFDNFIFQDRHSLEQIKNCLNEYKHHFFKLAIDDFGSGLSGLELLYHSEPNYIKIDRFFISEIERDSRKLLFVSAIMNIAHKLGISVIAEGVETENEFYSCKQIGCDLVQGYLIQRPTTRVEDLRIKYDIVSQLNSQNKRDNSNDHQDICDRMEYIEPIFIHRSDRAIVDMGTIFETFRRNKGNNFFPIINGNNEPVGVIREKDLKEYVYSPYGRDLLKNATSGNLSEFITKIPVSEIKTKIEKILEIFSFDAESEGLLLTDSGKYVGFLSANSLLKLLHDKNVSEARDQNPLTKLPGNTRIQKYVHESVCESTDPQVFVYFDFDNFKPFNDKYGFRQGDRAIFIFADLLRDISNRQRCFVGHVGGDDFFVGFNSKDIATEDILKTIESMIRDFSSSVQSMYTPAERERGYIMARSRRGRLVRTPLLAVSAGVMIIQPGQLVMDVERVFLRLAELKKKAKESAEKYYIGENF